MRSLALLRILPLIPPLLLLPLGLPPLHDLLLRVALLHIIPTNLVMLLLAHFGALVLVLLLIRVAPLHAHLVQARMLLAHGLSAKSVESWVTLRSTAFIGWISRIRDVIPLNASLL